MQVSDWIDLSGKTAHVTGAGRGIGAGIARALAAAGASVVASDIDAAAAARVADEIGGVSMALDVSDREAVDAALAETVERLGSLDIMVNNAGVYDGYGGSVCDITDEMWRGLWSVNVDGLFYCCRAAARLMIEAGRGRAHHQYRLHPGGDPRGRRYLRWLQGGGFHDHQGAGAGTGAPQDQCQHPGPRPDQGDGGGAAAGGRASAPADRATRWPIPSRIELPGYPWGIGAIRWSRARPLCSWPPP